MTSLQCIECIYYLGEIDGKLRCLAFNRAEKIKKIPQKFLNGSSNHDKPIKNQGNKYIYEQE